MTKEEVVDKLRVISRIAVQYVGMANYQSREDYALKEVDRCFKAFAEGRYDEIEFRRKSRDE
jgi:hypothetical protein